MMRRWHLVATTIIVLLYWAFAGQVSGTEALAMIVPATAALALTVSLDRLAERRFSAQAPWMKLVLRTFASVGRDAFKVGMFLTRALIVRPACPAGSTSAQPFCFGDDSSREATRRALTVISVSASPDRYVIDVESNGSLLSHSLAGEPTESDPEWPI